MVLLREAAAERGENVPGMEVWLTFVKYGYMMGGNIPMMNDRDLKKTFIEEPIKYKKYFRGSFGTDSLDSAGEERKCLVLEAGDEERSGKLYVPKALLRFGSGVRWSNESHDNAFPLYIEVTRPIDMVEKTLGCAFLWQNIDYFVIHGPKRDTGAFELEFLPVGNDL